MVNNNKQTLSNIKDIFNMVINIYHKVFDQGRYHKVFGMSAQPSHSDKLMTFLFQKQRGRLFSSWPVLLGSHFVDFYPIFMNLFVNEHKLVLVSGAGI